jgi:hypothetical protein
VHLPREIAAFFDALREGILQAASPFHSSVELEFRDQRRLGEAMLSCLSRRWPSRRMASFCRPDIQMI